MHNKKPIVLRSYQQSALDEIEGAFAFGSTHICLKAPLGSGKAVIIGAYCKNNQDKNIIIAVAMQQLVLQLSETLNQFNVDHSIIQAGKDKQYHPEKKIHIAMIQTLASRITNMPELKCDIFINDEHHHFFNTKSIEKILDTLQPKLIFGVSATPTTYDNYALPDTDILNITDVDTLVKNNFLAPLKYYVPRWAEKIDYSTVKKTAGEYNQEEINRLIGKEEHIKNIVKTMNQINAKNQKTIVFTTNLELAEKITNALREDGYNAFAYHSKLSKKDDENIINAFKTNTSFNGFQEDLQSNTLFQKNVTPEPVKCLVSIQKLIAGFDVKDINIGVLTAKTMIYSKSRQSIGRVMRISDSLSHWIQNLSESNEDNHRTAIIASYYNEVDEIRKQLRELSREDIDVFEYGSEPEGYDIIIDNVRPDKREGTILDLGKHISTFGFMNEEYNPPQKTGDKLKDKEAISNIQKQNALEHLSATLDDDILNELTRERYELKLKEISNTEKKLTEMTVRELSNKFDISTDILELIAIIVVLFDKIHCNDNFTDNWGNPVRGYKSNKNKDVVNFMNARSIEWIAQPWIDALEKETDYYRNKYTRSLKTRSMNLLKQKGSIYSLRFFIDWLIEEDKLEKEIIAEKEEPETPIIEYEGFDESDIPFGYIGLSEGKYYQHLI